MISKRFLKNSLIYTVAGSLNLASAVILLPFYISYLSPSTLGVLSIYTTFALLIQIFVTYSFDTAVYTYYHEFKKDTHQLNRYLSSSFTFVLCAGLIVGTVLALTGELIFANVFSGKSISFYPYGILSVLSGIFQAVVKVNSSRLQTQEKAVSFLWINLVSFSLTAILTIVGLHVFPDSLFGPIGGKLVAMAVTGLWVLAIVYKQHGFHFDFPLIRSTLGFNHPSLLYQVMVWFNGFYDRMLMAVYLPLSQVGIYDFVAKCLSVIEFALSGFYNSFFPKVLGILALQKEKKSTIEINRYYNGLTAVTLILVSVCIFSFPVILKVAVEYLGKTKYLEAIQWVPFLAITYLFRSMRFYVVMPYSALQYFKPLPVFYLFIVAAKISSMVILIPHYGIMGLVIATWIGYVVEISVLYAGIRKRFVMNFNSWKLVVIPLVMTVAILSLEPIGGNSFPLLIHAFYIFLTTVMLAWVYRPELKKLKIGEILK
ncbi:MAG: lipopolysaccharide biosynthesis protein [Bacteroidetes bacterium]|nr:lipopolysaccharide biosynthesis protein [Bacteroidota bacterium]MBS1541599.1 lipopolysaccharide biosynthesis protein [Bacteroidota bacterium]